MRIPLFTAAVAAALASGLSAQGALSTPCYVTPGTPLGLGDDQVSQGNALGFTFPGPGGVSVTSIDISSNGFVWLGSNVNSACCNGNEVDFLSSLPRIAAMWTDLYPPAGGDVYFNTFPASGSQPASASITWLDVPEIGTNTPQTVQMQLFADGSFLITFDGRVANVNHDALVGFTAGNNAIANAIDFSAITPSSPLDTGTNPSAYETQSFTFDLTGKSYAFLPNGTGGYLIFQQAACTFASATSYGVGCPKPATSYELFATGSTFDLSNTAIDFFPNGSGGYIAIPATGSFTPTSPSLTFFDDQVQGPFTLPFNFSFPGGSTNAIEISSNGFVWLGTGNFDSRCCNGDPASFIADPASIAVLWQDLFPPGGGTIHFDTNGATEAHITWSNVPEYGTPGSSNTAQLTLRSDGSWRLSYGTCANVNHDLLVGITQGTSQIDPGSTDFSAGVFQVNNGGTPLRLSAATLPALGTTLQLDVDQVTTGSLLGVLILGFGQVNPGVDLTFLGMPGCDLYATLDTQAPFPLAGPLTSLPLGIPATPSLAGSQFFSQVATFTPAANPFGFLSSNGLALTVGL